VQRLLLGAVVVLAVATLVGLAVWWPRGELDIDRDMLGFANRVDATVVAAELAPCTHDPNVECNNVTFEVAEGEEKGQQGTLEFETDDGTPASKLVEGDEIVVDDAGAEVPADARYSYADVQRTTSLWLLAGVFAVAVVALGRVRGLLALVGIVVSLGVLLTYVFPALLHGVSPLGVALTGSAVIAFTTLYLAHGVNARTTVALLGTMASLLLTAALATLFAGLAELSGLASEESSTLLTFAPDLDFRGLLLAAVIIGTLGVLDDVTITQVSAVWELHRSDRTTGARDLYGSGIRIGRDHIASTVNTLVLAYSAAALPLLLLFTQSGLGLADVLSTETVAVEVVQTLVGSIGLVASVPLTTALACWVVTRAGADDGDDPFPARSPGRGGADPFPADPAPPGPPSWTTDPTPAPSPWASEPAPPGPPSWTSDPGPAPAPAPGPAPAPARRPPADPRPPRRPAGAPPPRRPAPAPPQPRRQPAGPPPDRRPHVDPWDRPPGSPWFDG
jgi:uncharacterized membrane protein